MSRSTEKDPVEIPLAWILWMPVGQVRTDEAGDLVFPLVAAVPGIYRFMIDDGTAVVAGYIGQAAVSLAKRFSLYRSRGRRPSHPLERKTTSRNARCLIDALGTGHTVNVALVDAQATGPDGRAVMLDLADRAFRSSLGRRLILELCRTGIKVLNRYGNPGNRTLLNPAGGTSADLLSCRRPGYCGQGPKSLSCST
jgi:hypothetical protein